MAYLTLDKLKPAAVDKIKAFLDEVMYNYGDKIHSIHITGTAITDDFGVYDTRVYDIRGNCFAGRRFSSLRHSGRFYRCRRLLGGSRLHLAYKDHILAAELRRRRCNDAVNRRVGTTSQPILVAG